MSARRPARAGMTLIEVMLALSIASGVVTFIYLAARDVTKTKTRLEADAERLREAQMALERLGRDLRSAHLSAHKLPLQPRVDNAFVDENDQPEDQITMTTFTHRHRVFGAKDSDRCEVTWLLVEDPDDRSVTHLARRESPQVDDDVLEGGRIVVLVHDVVSFEIRYYDVDREEWADEWDTSQATAQPNRMPPQVQVGITLLDRYGGEIVMGTQIATEMRTPILLPGGFQ